MPPRTLQGDKILAFRKDREAAAGLIIDGHNLLDASLDEIIAKGLLARKVRRTRNSGVSKVEKVGHRCDDAAEHESGLHHRGIGQKKLFEETTTHIPRPKDIYGKRRRDRSERHAPANENTNRGRGRSRIHRPKTHPYSFAEKKADLLEKMVEDSTLAKREDLWHRKSIHLSLYLPHRTIWVS